MARTFRLRVIACLASGALFAASPAMPCLLQCLAHSGQTGGRHQHGGSAPCAGGRVHVGHEIPGVVILAVLAAPPAAPRTPTPVTAPPRPPAGAPRSIVLVPEPPPPRG